MLFKITSNDIFKDNPELMSIPEYAACSSRDLKYVFYCYDYKSPLRQLPIEDRKRKAVVMAGFKMETRSDLTRPIPDRNARKIIADGIPKVRKAIEMFKDSQYDEDLETYLAVKEQIRQYKDFLNKQDKDARELKDSAVILKLLKDSIDLVNDIKFSLGIEEEEEEEDIGTESLSLMDRVSMGLIDL